MRILNRCKRLRRKTPKPRTASPSTPKNTLKNLRHLCNLWLNLFSVPHFLIIILRSSTR